MAAPHFDLLLLALPVAAFLLSRRFSPARDAWWRSALRCALLFALGLTAAKPFLTDQGIGSGEAYNYSLALRDGIDQMRLGIMPPLVGQTEHAFNGRIHPLRNAPYLFYLADGLDIVTGRKLGPWELQNLSIAFSLIAAIFAMYGGLRWGTECPRPFALLLAAAYVFCPGMLAAAYSANLFMTLHAAPFVPIALAACFRPCRHPVRLPDVLLAGALAAAWLAHPPVAYWLTVAAVMIRGLLFWRYPTWRALRGLMAAVLLFAALAAFVFVSVLGISAATGAFAEGVNFGAAILPVLREAAPGALLPEHGPNTPTSTGDFQLGYGGWALLLILLVLLVRPPASLRRKPRVYCALLSSVAAVLLLLALTLPVPGLTAWLWDHAPVSAQSITNVWVLQRTYLIALAILLFAAAEALPRLDWSRPGRRIAAWAFAVVGALWSGHEGWQLLQRGELTRWLPEPTWRSLLSANTDITVTSYAFLEVPNNFTFGVTDPRLEFRLLRNGQDEIDSNYAAAGRTGVVAAQGPLRIERKPGAEPIVARTLLTLEPHRRYLLTLDFHTSPLPGQVNVVGPSLSRAYDLFGRWEAGFGMAPGHRHSLSIWTDQETPEIVSLTFGITDWKGVPRGDADFGAYTLQEVQPRRLPVQVESWVPLRIVVNAPEEGDFVETPRRWLPGYQAIVTSRSMAPLRSPWHNVMVPVPKGRSVIELRYPGSLLLRGSFWLSACAWLGFVAWAGSRAFGFRPGLACWLVAKSLGQQAARYRRPLLIGAAAVCVGAAFTAVVLFRQQALAQVGPVRVTFYLPFHQIGHTEPLVTTGQSGAGTTVYLRYLEGSRVKVGADIWGGAWESDPIPVNYFDRQALVVDSSGVYPLDNPAFAALPAAERQALRTEFRAELNGRTVLDLPRSAYDSTAAELVVGRNAIQSSVAEALFTGDLQKARRLPIPRRLALARDQEIGLRAHFPYGRLGLTEPLLSFGPHGGHGACVVTYLSEQRLRFSVVAPDGRVLQSAERDVNRSPNHDLAFSLQAPAPNEVTPTVGLKLDGAALIPPGPDPLIHPETLEVGVDPGLDPAAPAEREVRFTGSKLEVVRHPPDATTAVAGTGPLRLVLSFPQHPASSAEPLVTTGVTGKGDFVYVAYVDNGHVRFGFDHWGVTGGKGPIIPVDFGTTHDLTVSLGSLYPEESDPAWGGADPGLRHRLKSEFTVRLDGAEVLRADSSAWPSAQRDVIVGQNPIQGSSCGPAFTGLIDSVERPGLPAAPAAGSGR
ncbi:MAG TPA: hypothetical protein VHV47_12865 [Opitutaceae bacterium]|jgi:hypothetical protein|nr:hypothetical protein [Opitutaceae bacterium]